MQGYLVSIDWGLLYPVRGDGRQRSYSRGVSKNAFNLQSENSDG